MLFVDDSKATNPHAALASLLAYPRVVWVAGGQLKGAAVDDLVARVADRLAGVVLLGVDAPMIDSALSRHAPDVPRQVVAGKDDDVMLKVVSAAVAMAAPGDVVLLAPAAASLDMYSSYAARGNAFADAARSRSGRSPSGSRRDHDIVAARIGSTAGSADAVEPEASTPTPARPADSAPDAGRRAPAPKGAAGHRGLRPWLRQSRQSISRLAADWLDRPMTSLHLVLAIFALMLGFGLLMVLSSSSVSAFRTGGSSFSVFANQATYAVVGLICFCAAQYLPVRVMRSFSTLAVIISLALLVAVLLPGVGALVNGARSWIRLGGLQFQPSEVAKLALLVWMAHVLAARRSTLRSPKALLIPVLPVFALMAALIMMQPDLGTTVALTIVFMAVLFFAGAPWWMFAGLGIAGVVGFFALAFSADYRMARLLSFINPEAHPEVSYQLLQSLYGMGNGGWFGVGLGQSRAKWSYLPNADSDFIFAIIGEELGLIGAGILLLLFALLAYTGLRIARRNVDPFVKIVASAGTVWLVGQAAINIGYVVGSAARHRHPAADDLRRRHLAADHHGGVRAAGELRPTRTAGRRGAARRRRPSAGPVPGHAPVVHGRSASPAGAGCRG